MSAGISRTCDSAKTEWQRAADPDFGELMLEHGQLSSGLIQGLQKHGYRIVVAAPDDEYRPDLAGLGVDFRAVPINSAGLSPSRV